MSIRLSEISPAPTKASENKWRAVLITPGKGSSGIYTEEMLKEYGPKAFTKGTHSYIDHPSSENEVRSPKNLIGVLAEDARYEEGVGLVAEIEIMKHWKEFVEAVAPHTGLSIYAVGDGRRNENGEIIVEELIPDSQNSVDLVSYAGRPGSGLAEKLYEEAKRRVREAEPGELAERDLVKWDYEGEVMYGQVAYVMTEGVFPFEGDPLAIEASAEAPVALMRIWEGSGEDWSATDMLMGAPISVLTKVERLGESKRAEKGTAAVQPQLTKITKGNLMEKEEFEALFASLAEQVAAKVAETLAPVEPESDDVVDMAAVAEAAVKADIPEVFRKEIYEAAQGMTHEDAMALVEARKEVVEAIRKDMTVPAAEKVVEGRVVESGNEFSLTEIAKVAK